MTYIFDYLYNSDYATGPIILDDLLYKQYNLTEVLIIKITSIFDTYLLIPFTTKEDFLTLTHSFIYMNFENFGFI